MLFLLICLEAVQNLPRLHHPEKSVHRRARPKRSRRGAENAFIAIFVKPGDNLSLLGIERSAHQCR